MHAQIRGRSDALAAQDEAAVHSTLPFRAPELFDVASDARLDQRTDVWSLGCLLYALRYGFSPFECEFVGDGGGGGNGGGGGGAERAAGVGAGSGIGGVRVVECSFLRVIGQVSFPPYSSGGNGQREAVSQGFQELVRFALEQDPLKRPYVGEVLERALALAGVEVSTCDVCACVCVCVCVRERERERQRERDRVREKFSLRAACGCGPWLFMW